MKIIATKPQKEKKNRKSCLLCLVLCCERHTTCTSLSVLILCRNTKRSSSRERERTCLSHFTLTLPLPKFSFNPKPTSTFILLRTRPGEATMDARTQYNPRTVEEVFRDFKGRRAGLIKALTTGISNKP